MYLEGEIIAFAKPQTVFEDRLSKLVRDLMVEGNLAA
jgi:hypothetical protein